MNKQEVYILAFSTFLSLFALVLSIQSYRYNKSRGKVEQAINYAKVFETLIPRIGMITSILQSHNDLFVLINKVDFYKAEHFTLEEYKGFFTTQELKTIKKYFPDFDFNVGEILRCYFQYERSLPLQYFDESLTQEERYGLIKGAFSQDIIALLNRLEYFSMAFINNVADDEVVYQSLHQPFLIAIKTLYIPIALTNEFAHDKFYVNTTELFLKWLKRQREDQVKLEQKQLKLKKKMQNIKPKTRVPLWK